MYCSDRAHGDTTICGVRMTGFNFKAFAQGGGISKITDPATLFDALPNKAPGYGYLRAVQKTVLDAWGPRRDDHDLVIKTNTGGGKTIAGLLILQTCLNEKKGPALYVAPDPHLAGRVVQEAANLGLQTVGDPDHADFLAGRAICVTTMQRFLNGKTRFGLIGGRRQPVHIGSIVVDDAHAALAITEEQTRLTIPRAHPAWDALVELFADDLRSQSNPALLDIQTGDRSALLAIPFWAWQDRADTVLKTLHPYRNDETFEWAWPLIGDILPLCQAIVTAEEIEIVPPCPPIGKLPSFSEAQRRIYLTATLSDESVLVTHFDADPASVAKAIVPESAADLGDRLILSPQHLNTDINDEAFRDLVSKVAESHNVVVLAPSYRIAAFWEPVAAATVATADDIGGIVEMLKNGYFGLVVIIARYDGIDLPDAACRLLVIHGLPQAYSGYERREALALRDSEAMVTRQLQRIEQGMGRGVRSRDDRCVILLFGSDLVRLAARADIADRFSPATRAQLDLSYRVATGLKGSDTAALLSAIIQVIDGDEGFRQASREELVGVTYGETLVSPTATSIRRAFNAATRGQYQSAIVHAQEAVDNALNGNDERLAGWLGEGLAAYTHKLAPTEAQAILTTAVGRNSAVLRPAAGLIYKHAKPSAQQSIQASTYLSKCYETGTELVLGVEAVLANLVWDNDRTNDTEQALADLGEHLGFTSQRPERDFGKGGDVLWVIAEKHYLAIEAKSGVTANTPIWKKYVDQLGGFANWCKDEYGDDTSVTPMMMHPSAVVEQSSTAPQGAVGLTKQLADNLKAAALTLAKSLAANDAYKDPQKVQALLDAHKFSGAQFIAAYTTPLKAQ